MNNLKSDFPIFTTHPDLVYLDSASTTHKPNFVIEQTNDFIAHSYANVGRGSYPLAMAAEDIYDASKEAAAKLINTSAEQIIYTYSSTYAYNMLATSLVDSGVLTPGSSIIISISEHHANLVVRQQLSQRYGFTIKRCDLAEDFNLDYAHLESLMDETVKVVSLTGASNVTGAITDIVRVRQIIGLDVFLAIDGSQLVPNRYVDVTTLNIDALIWTAHKMMGYTGLGILYLAKPRVFHLIPSRVGGAAIDTVTQQGFTLQTGTVGREPGTPNLITAASYLYALQYFDSLGGYKRRESYEQELIEYVLSKFAKQDRLVVINKQTENRLGVFSFYLADKGNIIQFGEKLGQQGVCIRTGGHCAHPLVDRLGYGQLGRLSLYVYNTKKDIDKFFEMCLQSYSKSL